MPFDTNNKEDGSLSAGGSTSPLDRTTQRLFLQGEQPHQGEQRDEAPWQDTVVPLEDDAGPRPSDSFDAIPRRRGASIGLIAAAACLGGGVGLLGGILLKTGPRADDAPAVHERVEDPGVTIPAPRPAAAAAPASPAEPAQLPTDEAEKAEATPAASPDRETEKRPTEALAGRRDSAESDRKPQVSGSAKARPRKARPLENYVWSPAIGALVPESSWAGTPSPAAAPSTSEPSSKGADEVRPASPGIAPATTGAAPTERLAPPADTR